MIGVPRELISEECLERIGAIQQGFVQVEQNGVDHRSRKLRLATAITDRASGSMS